MKKSSIVMHPALAGFLTLAGNASAFDRYSDEQSHLSATLQANFGVFHSERSYATSGTLHPGTKT